MIRPPAVKYFLVSETAWKTKQSQKCAELKLSQLKHLNTFYKTPSEQTSRNELACSGPACSSDSVQQQRESRWIMTQRVRHRTEVTMNRSVYSQLRFHYTSLNPLILIKQVHFLHTVIYMYVYKYIIYLLQIHIRWINEWMTETQTLQGQSCYWRQ